MNAMRSLVNFRQLSLQIPGAGGRELIIFHSGWKIRFILT
jgi:hypothetical protein